MPEVAGALFYEQLFAANPSFRPLFKKDMRIQGTKLMTMLAMIVYNLPEPGNTLPSMRDLAVRHLDYGVKVADYDPVVREAWTVFYDELAGEMKAAVSDNGFSLALDETSPGAQ